ncbi:MAG: thiamine phosphate synthase [candidate division Zixibacteria bacterium]|nr:thiamine phosphate synthase [candidate division Zixibacteria bacterium]
MNKKDILAKAKLYLIVDADLLDDEDLEKVTLEAIEGGADLIQFRGKTLTDGEFLKTAESLKEVTDHRNIPLIINDRVEMALYLNAAGVHLGQEDLPVSVIRKLLGEEKIIGISASNLKEAKKAQEDGADYIGVGPVFYTQTKKIIKTVGLELIREIKREITLPFFAIGGINLDNVDEVRESGADKIAVASAVLKTKDPKLATRKLRDRL